MSEPLDGAAYRSVVGHFASGVTVVTATVGGEPVGFTCQAFASVSLEPAMVLFCVARSSQSYRLARPSKEFCVNVLAEEQEPLARAFALRGTDKFAGLGWHPGPNGAPVLAGSLAWLAVTLAGEHPGGDHHVCLCRVTAMEAARGRRPLVFYRGGFGSFEI